jgi:hypothetical protein
VELAGQAERRAVDLAGGAIAVELTWQTGRRGSCRGWPSPWRSQVVAQANGTQRDDRRLASAAHEKDVRLTSGTH